MMTSQLNGFRAHFKQALKKAIGFPLLLLIVGLGLTFTSSLHFIQSYHQWDKLINIASDFGNTLVLFSFVLLSFLLSLHLINAYLKQYNEMQYYSSANVLFILKSGLKIIFALVTFNIILSAIELDHKYFLMAHNVIYVIIIAAIAWTALQLLPMIENALQKKHSSQTALPDARRAAAFYTRFHIIKNIATVIIVLIAIAASLMVFDKVKNLGISLLASAGLLTAVIAFAAQKTLGSFFVGLQLVLSHPLEIGDSVLIEGQFGTIEEINLSYITVKLWDLKRLVLPISYFIERPFQNWSKSLDGLIGPTFIYVDYTLPIDVLRQELNKIVQETPLWDKRVCTLAVTNLTENTVEVRVLVSSANPGSLFDLQCFVREKMLRFICDKYPHSLPRMRVNQTEVRSL